MLRIVFDDCFIDAVIRKVLPQRFITAVRVRYRLVGFVFKLLIIFELKLFYY